MDPAIELATLVVSYVWPLRGLFPEAKTVFELTDGLPQLDLRVGRDFALIERLAEISSRTADETWSGMDDTAPMGHAADDLDQIRRERLNRPVDAAQPTVLAPHERPGAEPSPPTAASHAKLETLRRAVGDNYRKVGDNYRNVFLGEPNREDEIVFTRKRLEGFGQEAAKLCAHPSVGFLSLYGVTEADGESPPAEREMTRDTFTTRVAAQLISQRALAAIATVLNYCPLILRELREAGGPRASRQPSIAALLDDLDYPRALIAACKERRVPLPFSLVAHAELDEIEAQRKARGTTGRTPAATVATGRAYDSDLVALCISGGGIRSATFALGVLHGLANRGWLPQIDYLSTVSGGGYIGSWLVAWIKRAGSVRAVERSLQGYHSCDPDEPAKNPDPGAEHLRPIRLLREYSSYLAPKGGAFSTDTWTIAAIWMRNTLLNLLTLTLFLMAALMLPRTLGVLFVASDRGTAVAACIAAVLSSAFLVALNLKSFEYAPRDGIVHGFWRVIAPPSTRTARGDTSFLILATIVVPMVIAGFFAVRALWLTWELAGAASISGAALKPIESAVLTRTFELLWAGIIVTAVFGHSLTHASTHVGPASLKKRLRRVAKRTFISSACGIVPAAIGALCVLALWKHVLPILFADTHRGTWMIVAFGPVTFIAVVGLVIILYLGFEGMAASDERREWWSRLGAWLSIVGVGWGILTTIAYFSPYLMARGGISLGSAAFSWGTLTALGAWLASSGKSNGINLPFDRNWATSLIITTAPYVFMLGFLVAVTALTQALELWLRFDLSPEFGSPPFSLVRFTETYWSAVVPEDVRAPFLALGLLVAAFLLAWRVDVNEFSMHHFYRNRLVRAYLGASRSRRHRRPNAFTGLDMDDDIKLWRFTSQDQSTLNDALSDCRLGYQGPFPVINATLNMTAGDELAYRERKGQSFVFTPLYCGYDFATKQTAVRDTALNQFALRPSREFGASPARWSGGRKMDPIQGGLEIGTAVAISGAAANPNAGYHSSPAVAFLLTVFNVRLGWWIGNPRRERWDSGSPSVGLPYLLSELFGFSSTERDYVNLSDGGHFDNMGLYEMVRRRCRYIIVCDGEQDDHYSFNGLAGAIRKCRLDFGVTIALDVDAVRPRAGVVTSQAHAVVGTITYPEGCGTIVYLKASMTGDEPTDVKEYHSAHPEFPHQPTADQFFGESQFESYRALGQHIADSAFPSWDAAPAGTRRERLERHFPDIARRH
jgi:hypothetical protein